MRTGTGRLLGALLVVGVGLAFMSPFAGLPAGSVISSATCDTAAHFYAWRHYGFGLMREGQIALWNPYVLCGVPFLAAAQPALLYPANAIFLALPTAQALNWSFVLHVLLAGLAAYVLALVLGAEWVGAAVGGCAYMLSATVVHRLHAGHLPQLCVLAWFPLGLAAVERFVATGRLRWAVSAGLVAAMQITAGHLQLAAYAQGFAWLYLLLRSKECFATARVRPWRVAAGLGLMLLLPAALSAAQLLPAAEYAGLSVRRHMAGSLSTRGPLAPLQLLTLLTPDFFGGVRSPYWGYGYFWGATCYVGAATLALAIAGLWHRPRGRVAALVALALLSVALAMGPHTPVFGLAAKAVPALRLFRGAAWFTFAAALALCMLASLGASVLHERRRGLAATLVGVGVLGLLLAAAGLWLTTRPSVPAWWAELLRSRVAEAQPGEMARLPGLDELPATLAAAGQSVLLAGLWLMAGAAAALFAHRKPTLGLAVVFAIVAADLVFYGSKFLTTFDSRRCHLPREAAALLKDKPPGRVLAPEIGLLNRGMPDRISTIDGFDAIMPYYVAGTLAAASSRPVRFAVTLDKVGPLTRLLNGRYLLYRPGAAPKGMRLLLRTKQYDVWEDPAAVPRAFVEREGKRLGAAKVIRDAAHTVRVDVDAPAAGSRLVLSDTDYPGWRAYVAGRRATVVRAHGMLRAVALDPAPAGLPTLVRFAYHPLSFLVGAFISLLACAGLVAACSAQLAAHLRQTPPSSSTAQWR